MYAAVNTKVAQVIIDLAIKVPKLVTNVSYMLQLRSFSTNLQYSKEEMKYLLTTKVEIPYIWDV